jgi:hypothetical protein
MLEKIPDALNAINRVPAVLLLMLVAAAAFILFIPERLAVTLALDAFRNTYRVYLGPGLTLVGFLLLARLIAFAATKLQQRGTLSRLRKSIATLTNEEKGYLAEFIETGRTAIYVPLDDGIIGALVARQIVYRSSNVFDVLEGVPYNLQPWAREYLTNNPQVLEGAEGRPLSPREKRRPSLW